jgi:hypothetical protein
MSIIIQWQRVLDTNNIEYIDRGPNVKRGNLNIRCPFCGAADPSHHMGISLSTGYWACWRNSEHRGKSPVRLLVKLLRISYEKARAMAGLDADYVDPDGFTEVMAKFMSKGAGAQETTTRAKLDFPSEFVELFPKGSTRRHWNYLVHERGFAEQDLDEICYDYYLMAGVDGKFKDRIILPFIMNGELVAWSGRAIAESSIRYRDSSLETSLVAPKETLFNHDAMLGGGKNLIVVEGQIDALKLDYYGRDWGTRSVGVSTNSMTEEQIYILDEFSQRFETTYFMLDNKTQFGIVDSMRLKSKLSQIKNPQIINVPFNKGDAGDLSPEEAVLFCRGIS